MHKSFRRSLILGIGTAVLLTSPMLLSGTPLSAGVAAFAGNGNGNGGGSDNAGGNGNGGGSGGDHGGGSDHAAGNGGGHRENSSSSDAAPQGKKARISLASTGDSEASSDGKNLNAQLAGLNSLKRNINGLMKSSDPRMTEIRQFIVASADLVDAKAILEDASGELEDAENDYLSLLQRAGIQPSLDITPTMVENRIGEIERILEEEPPEDPTDLNDELEALQGALDGLAAQWAVVEAERGELADAAEDVAALEDATDAGALEDALRAAANRSRGVTDEVIEWASLQLGVGDADGLIDDYIERR